MNGVVIGVIFAVIALLFLFPLAGHAFEGIIKDIRFSQAEGTLEELVGVIKTVNEIKESREMVMQSPNDWGLIAFPIRNGIKKYEKLYPMQCREEKSCVCICDLKDGPIPYKIGNEAEVCSARGVCKNIDLSENIIIEDLNSIDKGYPRWVLKIDGPTWIVIEYSKTRGIIIRRK